MISEWVRGAKITVGPPYFNQLMVPIGLFLLLLVGIGPIVGWRKTTSSQLREHFLVPTILMILVSASVLFFAPRTSSLLTNVYVNVSFSLCVFVMATIVSEYVYGMRVRKKSFGENPLVAFIRLLWGNRRRYGGYVVHVGVVLLFVGFTGNAYKNEKELNLKPNQTADLGKYQIRYEKLLSSSDDHKDTVTAQLSVWKDKQFYTWLLPARVFFRSAIQGEPPQPSTEIAIDRSLKEDLYAALLSFDTDNRSIFVKAVINPLVQFIWIGGLFMILGGVIVMWPERREAIA